MSSSSTATKTNFIDRWFWPTFGLIFLLAAVVRLWKLSVLPAGLHQDEAWFAYNAFLLLKRGTNIYNQHWPLTVDMWGDHVSAIHSYMIVPFIALFGVKTWVFRLTFVSFSLACLSLASYLMWLLTKSKTLVLGTAALFAISVWNIVMTRASSTVIIDTTVLLILSVVFVKSQQWASQRITWTNKDKRIYVGVLVCSYALTIAGYFTYFTSRLMIPPFLVAMIVFVWWGKKLSRWAVGAALVVVIAYMIFPFGVMLRTPYALGRYQETAILNSNTVKSNQFQDISRAGQSHLPVVVTRVMYNKVEENAAAFLKQYVGLLSPSTLLFQTAPPIRYNVPDAGSVSYIEYIGVLAAVGIVLVGGYRHKYFKVSVLLLFFVLVAALPSALTEDDFPNLQRAVIMTPFLQMLAAVGLWSMVTQLWPQFEKLSQIKQRSWYIILLFVLSAPTFISFLFGYFVQMKYSWPVFRSRAGEELALWINANAHDDPILMEHVEGNFFYPYLFGQEDMLQLPIEKSGQYFLNARKFKIGNRMFVADLCSSPEIKEDWYKYVIVYTLHEQCHYTDDMVKVYSAQYDDGAEGFAVYRRKTAEELGASMAASAAAKPKTK